MIKFRIPYVHRLGENFTASELFVDICEQAGVEAGNTSFVNSDYVILGNAYTNNETCEAVLKDLAKLAIGYARIDRFNKCQIHTLSLNKIEDTIDGNDYKDTFEKNTVYGEVNKLSIGMTGVDGEWVIRQDEASITQNGETLIENNDIYFLIDEEERNKVADNMWNNIKGLKYLSANFEYKGFPYLDAGDKIKLLDVNDEEYSFYVFSHTFEYNGTYAGKIDTPLTSKVQQQYKPQSNDLRKTFRNVQLKVNKIDGEITSIVEQQDEIKNDLTTTSDKVSKIEQDISGINTTVSSVETTIETVKTETITKVEVLYALSASTTVAPKSGWSTTAPTWTDGKYMWQKTVTTYVDGTSKEASAICISGAKGQDGKDGANGKDGAKGETGKGIQNITNHYLASISSSGVTTSTTGWTDTIQSITSSKRYLWNYETITYTDNSTSSTTPVIIGVWGNTGSTGSAGKGIKSITEHYQISTSNSTVPTSWVNTVPTLTSTNKYLWNYETITYTDNTTTDTDKRVIGVYGDKGNDGTNGISVTKVEVEYYLSTSSTSQSGGSWSTTVPAWANGKYMWSRTKTTLSNGNSTTTSPVCITGAKGDTGAKGTTGATGTGVSGITTQFYLSTSKTAQSGGSWTTTMPTWSSGKYLWTRSKIVYTNPEKTVYTAAICDSSWEAVNEVQVGGRNYVLGMSKEWSDWITPGTGTNKTSYITTLDLKTLNLIYGDYISLQLEFESIGFTSGKIWTQGAVNGVWSGENHFPNPWGYVMPDVSANKNNINKPMKFTKIYEIPNLTIDKINNVGGLIQLGFRCDNGNVEGKYRYRCIKIEKGNKPTDWTPAPEDIDSNIQDVQADANNAMYIANNATATAANASDTARKAQESANNIQEQVNELQTDTEQVITEIKKTVETTQTNSQYAINIAQSIIENGVTKLDTKTGFTFDEKGLTIEKTGAKAKTTLNEIGLDVKDNTGHAQESLLFAGYDSETGETVVKSKNMTVEKYLTMGKYSRVEDYETGTGIFYMGE